MDTTNHSQYLAPACEIARAAGGLIMGYFSGGFTTAKKDDNSPVTEADLAANAHITKALFALAAPIPVVAEEDALPASIPSLFFLVDPLDGTRSFVRGEAEFTVNIALIEQGKPLWGVIYCPPQDTLYWGAPGQGAFRRQGQEKAVAIGVRTPPADGLTIFRSRTEPGKTAQAYLDTLKVKEMISSSSSVKFCKVAEGSADIYPRFGRTMEWDTAAGQAILEAAGGRVETVDGKPFGYGKPGFENPGFIAFGR